MDEINDPTIESPQSVSMSNYRAYLFELKSENRFLTNFGGAASVRTILDNSDLTASQLVTIPSLSDNCSNCRSFRVREGSVFKYLTVNGTNLIWSSSTSGKQDQQSFIIENYGNDNFYIESYSNSGYYVTFSNNNAIIAELKNDNSRWKISNFTSYYDLNKYELVDLDEAGLEVGDEIKIRSHNLENKNGYKYIRHQNYDGWVHEIPSPSHKYYEDRIFIVRRGQGIDESLNLNGFISLESKNKAGYFLKENNGYIRLVKLSSSTSKKLATFRVTKGLADNDGYSFMLMPTVKKNYFLRHKSHRLRVHALEYTSPYVGDATYHFE
ncbi:MAG: AbfB domain-containing protein [Reichenbachiella sp.]